MSFKPTPIQEFDESEVITLGGMQFTLKVPTLEDFAELEAKYPLEQNPVTVSKLSKSDYIEGIEIKGMRHFANEFMKKPQPEVVSRMRNLLGSMVLCTPNAPPVVILFSEYNQNVLCTVCTQKLVEELNNAST